MKKTIFILLSLFITLITNPVNAQKIEGYNNTCKQLSTHAHTGIVNCDDKYGVYDKHNKKFIIEPKFDSIERVSMYNMKNYYYLTKLNNKKGLLSSDGTELLTPKYDLIAIYSSSEPDKLKVEIDNKSGIYSITKKDFIIQPVYEKVNLIDNNKAYQISHNHDIKIINSNGKVTSELKIDVSKCITKKKCIVQNNTKVGLYDTEHNKYILEPIFDEIINKNNNIIQVSRNNLQGLYTLDGKLILDAEFTHINPYFTYTNPFFTGDKQINRILVKKNNKYGIYDGEKGKYFIEPNYDHIVYSCKTYKTIHSEKTYIVVYRVLTDNKITLIDNNGKDLLGEKFESISNATPIDSTICLDQLLVKDNGKFGVYNAITHSYFIEPKFDKIVLYTNKKYNNMWEVKIADKVGLLDNSGNIIFDTIYDSFEIFHNNNRYIGVEQNKKFAVYDIKNQKLSKFIYDSVTLNKFDELVVRKGNNKNLYKPVVSTLKTAGYVIIWLPLMPVYICVFGIIPIVGVMMM